MGMGMGKEMRTEREIRIEREMSMERDRGEEVLVRKIDWMVRYAFNIWGFIFFVVFLIKAWVRSSLSLSLSLSFPSSFPHRASLISLSFYLYFIYFI